MDPEEILQSQEKRLRDLEEKLTTQKSQLDQILALLRPSSNTAQPPLPGAAQTAPTPNTPKTTTIGSSRNVRPALPVSYDGDRKNGRAFWNSITFYMGICGSEFASLNAQIMWALSYMNQGRASTYAEVRLRAYEDANPPFELWEEFQASFKAEFFPMTEREDALNDLFAHKYYQRERSVDDYVDSFNQLIYLSGHTEGLAITSLFRQGLNPVIQNKVATMQDRPDITDFAGWCRAARRFDRDRVTNLAFNAAQSRILPQQVRGSGLPRPNLGFGSVLPIPRPPTYPAPFIPRRPFVPEYRPPPGPPPRVVPAPNPPAPIPRSDAMDVDAARRRTQTEPARCFRCGRTDHFARDCPHLERIRTLDSDEIDEEIERLFAAKDVLETQARAERIVEGAEIAEEAEGNLEDFRESRE